MTFNLELLAQALVPMPYVVINDQIFLLTAIESAEAQPDGGLTMVFVSGNEYSLPPEDAAMLTTALKVGLERAQQLQANKIARDLHIIPSFKLKSE